jgi:sec-independent protein translocase protein TatB
LFDFSFSELMVIGVVALIVIGPEKLPRVARTLGLLAGKMQRYVSSVKSDISREMQLEDLRKLEQEIKQAQLTIQHQISELDHIADTPAEVAVPAKVDTQVTTKPPAETKQ